MHGAYGARLMVIYKVYDAKMAFVSPSPVHITLHNTGRDPPHKIYNIIPRHPTPHPSDGPINVKKVCKRFRPKPN